VGLRRIGIVLAALTASMNVGCGDGERAGTGATSTTTVSAEEAASLLAVGDIASCEWESDEEVARMAERQPDATVLLLGDIAYDRSTEEILDNCFRPAWDPVLSRSLAVPGNHDLVGGRTEAFDELLQDMRAGTEVPWTVELGKWTLLGLDSNCGEGCDKFSEQWIWLRKELEAIPDDRCALVAMHHPPISSGSVHGGVHLPVTDLWQAAHEGGADLVLAGHEHIYERFAPLSPGLRPAADGLPLFIVGTGGAKLYGEGERQAGSEFLQNTRYGMLELELGDGEFSWFFEDVDGRQVDAGSSSCRP
jgi:acid phosphatase type 7